MMMKDRCEAIVEKIKASKYADPADALAGFVEGYAIGRTTRMASALVRAGVGVEIVAAAAGVPVEILLARINTLLETANGN